MVKVYASDEEELSCPTLGEPFYDPTPCLQPVVSRSEGSQSETAPSLSEGTDVHAAPFMNGFAPNSDSGCVNTADDALDEVELVRQAALQVSFLLSIPLHQCQRRLHPIILVRKKNEVL